MLFWLCPWLSFLCCDGKKGDWWNFHNHISHIKKKHLGYWGEECLLQHMMTCKTYYGINNHVLFFKDLNHGIIIYHLIFASHGFVFMHSAFFFPTKDFTFEFIIKLHTAHEVLQRGLTFWFVLCLLMNILLHVYLSSGGWKLSNLKSVLTAISWASAMFFTPLAASINCSKLRNLGGEAVTVKFYMYCIV